jgi:RNA polymerase sigma-70 factor (ECF subfamily)
MLSRTVVERQRLASQIASHRSHLHQRAVALVGREGAEDLVQSTLERALRHLEGFVPESNLSAWLKRIQSNLIVDQWRGDRRRQRAFEELAKRQIAREEEFERERGDWELLSSADLDHAIASLPPSMREIYDMHQRQRLNYNEIGAKLGIKPSTVGTRLLRARGRLRTILGALLAERGRPANDIRVERLAA